MVLFSKEALIKNKKPIIMVVSIIMLIFIFFLGVTAYTTYKASEDNSYNVQTSLNSAEAEKSRCFANLEKAKTNMSACVSNITSKDAEISLYKNNLNNATQELSRCKIEKDAAGRLQIAQQKSFNQLVLNSVRSVCCSFSDVDKGELKNWSISGNSIVCSGGYIVNCKTGETDFKQ